MKDTKKRCRWCTGQPIYIDYHDQEWGVQLHDDQKLFEMLILEGAQAGLNWITVLKKRAHYQRVYDAFVPEKVAAYGETKIGALLQDQGIIRNKLKVRASVANAVAFLKVRDEFGSFDRFIWQFTDGQPITNAWKKTEDVPAVTAASTKMSKELKKRGFRFVGPTICYAFMQATGMVNDHTTDCFRWQEIKTANESIR